MTGVQTCALPISVLAKLGAEASIVSVVGVEPLSDAVLADLRAAGVRLNAVVRDPAVSTSAAIVMIAANGEISGYSLAAAMIILCREILVSGMREFLAELRVGLPVSTVAKWKTTLQLLAIGFLIAGRAGETVLPGTTHIGLGLLWVAALLTLYTGWDYMRAGMKYVED